MKMPARILLILGAVALVAAIGVLFYGGFEVWRASFSRSTPCAAVSLPTRSAS